MHAYINIDINNLDSSILGACEEFGLKTCSFNAKYLQRC